MRSVADDLRRESRAALASLTAAERVALALRLGRLDVERLSAARHISPQEAVDRFRRVRQHGRRPSVAGETAAK